MYNNCVIAVDNITFSSNSDNISLIANSLNLLLEIVYKLKI